MSERRSRFWTEDDKGFVLDNPEMSARELGELIDRSGESVQKMRRALAQGFSPSRMPWSETEDDIIIAGGPYATIEALTSKLPGRTSSAIKERRQTLGVNGARGLNKSPHTPGGRPLIAKSCVACGLLLPSDWFAWRNATRTWASRCKKCASQYVNRYRKGPDDAERKRRARSSSESYRRFQATSLERATNRRQPYTAEDHKVLADPDLTLHQKALRLGRSYAAVADACSVSGYKSHVGLGDAEKDIWVIENPNAPLAPAV